MKFAAAGIVILTLCLWLLAVETGSSFIELLERIETLEERVEALEGRK